MRNRLWVLVSSLVLLSLLSGCTRDPEKAKRRYLESGQRYMQQKKYAEARIQFKNALKNDPKFVDAYLELAKAEMALKAYPDAFNDLQQALALDAKRDDVRVELGRLYIGAGSFKDAEDQANAIIEHDPKNAMAYLILGNAHSAQQRPQLALDTFKKYIELAPNDSDGYMNAGLSSIALHQFGPAEDYLKKAVQINSTSLAACKNLANFYRLTREYDKEAAVLEAGLQHIPDKLELYVARADLLWAMQHPDQVGATFDQMRKHLGDTKQVSLAIGDFYAIRKAYDKSMAEFQHGLSISKNDVEFKNRMVETYITLGKLDDATRLNDEVLKEAPKDVLGRVQKGRILASRQQFNEAINYLRSATADAPENVSAHFHLARVLMQTNQANLATAELNEAIKIAPDNPDVLQAMGQLQLLQNELPTALGYAQRKVQLYPLDPTGHMLMGAVLGRQKKFAEGEQQFKFAVQLAPNNPEVYLDFGNFYASTGKPKDAEAQYETALNVANQYTPALSALADLLQTQKQLPRAISRTEGFVKAYPDNWSGHTILGGLYLKSKDWERAKTELNRAVQLNSSNILGYIELGTVYQNQKQTDAAIQTFKKVLELQPRSAPVMTMIGNLYLDKNDYVQARSFYEQALANDPNTGVAAGNLAWVYAIDGGNLDMALTLAQKAKQLMPEVPSISDTLGWVYYKRANYNSALPLLKECVEREPQQATYRYHLGMTLMQTGQKEEAKRYLEAALKMDLTPRDSVDARKALDQLR